MAGRAGAMPEAERLERRHGRQAWKGWEWRGYVPAKGMPTPPGGMPGSVIWGSRCLVRACPGDRDSTLPAAKKLMTATPASAKVNTVMMPALQGGLGSATLLCCAEWQAKGRHGYNLHTHQTLCTEWQVAGLLAM